MSLMFKESYQLKPSANRPPKPVQTIECLNLLAVNNAGYALDDEEHNVYNRFLSVCATFAADFGGSK